MHAAPSICPARCARRIRLFWKRMCSALARRTSLDSVVRVAAVASVRPCRSNQQDEAAYGRPANSVGHAEVNHSAKVDSSTLRFRGNLRVAMSTPEPFAIAPFSFHTGPRDHDQKVPQKPVAAFVARAGSSCVKSYSSPDEGCLLGWFHLRVSLGLIGN